MRTPPLLMQSNTSKSNVLFCFLSFKPRFSRVCTGRFTSCCSPCASQPCASSCRKGCSRGCTAPHSGEQSSSWCRGAEEGRWQVPPSCAPGRCRGRAGLFGHTPAQAAIPSGAGGVGMWAPAAWRSTPCHLRRPLCRGELSRPRAKFSLGSSRWKPSMRRSTPALSTVSRPCHQAFRHTLAGPGWRMTHPPRRATPEPDAVLSHQTRRAYLRCPSTANSRTWHVRPENWHFTSER